MVARMLLPTLLTVLATLVATPSHAGIVKDHISDPANWSGVRTAPSNYGTTIRYNTVAAFTGDGGII